MKPSAINLTKLIAFSMLIPAMSYSQNERISNFRSYDKEGINVFETSKKDSSRFTEPKVKLGANFTQQFQDLKHSNNSLPVIDPLSGKNTNQLMANLNLDAQLADGIRLNLVTYLSSRHHQEAWVKGGYIQIDRLSVLNSAAIDRLMKYVTIKVGHSEINYGDAHFRRTDNGNAMYNPFVGNLILDAFTTEIGSEVYFQNKGWIAMAGITGGEIKGDVTNPSKRHASYLGKLGYDKQTSENLRLRLTGSFYTNAGASNQTLYRGDRAGSRYYMVLENTAATVSANAWSGHYNPVFHRRVEAVMINPFVKFCGFEFFGTYEIARGNSAAESGKRKAEQWAVDGVYRLGKKENLFVGARYNQVKGDLLLTPATSQEIKIERVQLAGGWFITKNILAKAEYVTQQYHGFPASSILNGGKFNGFMLEGVIGF
jgi:hypothetical protein